MKRKVILLSQRRRCLFLLFALFFGCLLPFLNIKTLFEENPENALMITSSNTDHQQKPFSTDETNNRTDEKDGMEDFILETFHENKSKIVLITNNNMDHQQQQNSTDEISNGIDDKDDMAVRCKAACPEHLKHNNIIILDKKYFRGKAGLNDRMNILKRIGSIAANLCATVYTPPPYQVVSTRDKEMFFFIQR